MQQSQRFSISSKVTLLVQRYSMKLNGVILGFIITLIAFESEGRKLQTNHLYMYYVEFPFLNTSLKVVMEINWRS